MSVSWRDKAGITHAWDAGPWATHVSRRDNHHAGWYTARALCGASRALYRGTIIRLRGGHEGENRVRGATVDCMTCLIREGESQ